MQTPEQKVIALSATDGQAVSVGGGTYRIVISGAQTANQYAIIEMIVPPGGGPGPHAHAAIQESFYVVEGEVEVKTEAESYTAAKGAFVTIPLGGIVHCFKNKSAQMATLLCIVSPAGMDKMFLELGEPVKAGSVLPPTPMTPEKMEKFTAIAEKYGQKLYPPNYLDK